MREDLLQSAISFLSSTQVQSAEKEKKVQFLRNKGLNDEEIQEAFKRVCLTANTSVQSAPRLPPRSSTMYQQVVYYPPPPIPRMTTKQLLSYGLVIGISTLGITVTLTMIIKKFMSRVFNKIANYQRNRYQRHTKLLSRMESILKSFSTSINNPALEDQQIKLNTSLNQLFKSSDAIKERTQPYKNLRSDVERLRLSLIQTPTNGIDARNSNAFGPYSGFASSYADRYQVDTKYNATIQSIKSEIRSVKGMLLSRRNFPIVSTIPTPVNIPPTPTIPAQNAYHPRRRQSYRSELTTTNPQATTVQEVEDAGH